MRIIPSKMADTLWAWQETKICLAAQKIPEGPCASVRRTGISREPGH